MVVAVRGSTRILGVIGDPVAHSRSPAMHNAALAHLGLDYVYVPFYVPRGRLGGACEGLRALGVRGFNVTIPHKVDIIGFLDRISPEAELIGAVNTVVNDDGQLHGFNTDGAGFVRSFTEASGRSPRGLAFAVLGAGGAAQAVAIQLALDGAERVLVLNRTYDKAAALVRTLKERIGADAEAMGVSGWPPSNDAAAVSARLQEVDVIVNTTSVGMHAGPDAPPAIPADWLRAEQWVCDIVYTPPLTPLLAAAERGGAHALPGMGMLVQQGAIAFTHFTGRPAPDDVMHRALMDALAG